jgi:hypothetical protein
MNQGAYLFSQLISIISPTSFRTCVKRYNGDYKTKDFNCWRQYLCMVFGQLTHRENLSDMDGITLLQNDTDRISTNWIFTVLVENLVGFGEWMGECGIHVSKVHNRNDLHPLVAKYKCHLPNVDYVSQRMVAIPVGWWVTKEDREYIVDCIKNGW